MWNACVNDAVYTYVLIPLLYYIVFILSIWCKGAYATLHSTPVCPSNARVLVALLFPPLCACNSHLAATLRPTLMAQLRGGAQPEGRDGTERPASYRSRRTFTIKRENRAWEAYYWVAVVSLSLDLFTSIQCSYIYHHYTWESVPLWWTGIWVNVGYPARILGGQVSHFLQLCWWMGYPADWRQPFSYSALLCALHASLSVDLRVPQRLRNSVTLGQITVCLEVCVCTLSLNGGGGLRMRSNFTKHLDRTWLA